MNLEASLAQRLGKLEVEQLAHQITIHPENYDSLFHLTQHPNATISWHAWWVCDTLSRQETSWLAQHQQAIIDYALTTTHSGKRRLALSILLRLPLALSTDLLNFCLDTMSLAGTTPAVSALCMKLAYKLCVDEPELLNELQEYLTYMDTAFYTSAVIATRKNILQAMRQKKLKSRANAYKSQQIEDN